MRKTFVEFFVGETQDLFNLANIEHIERITETTCKVYMTSGHRVTITESYAKVNSIINAAYKVGQND